MHAIQFHSVTQFRARMTAKVHRSEPQLQSRRRADRLEAAERLREHERRIRTCMWPAMREGVSL